MKLSAIIITKNEEANLERCLQSISWVDEIIVVDSASTDATVEIARRFGARIFSPEWQGFGPAKQYAFDQASGDWVLSIDADEEISFTLKSEIHHLLEQEPSCAGYAIPRKTQFLGRWILYSGWSPDYVVRLFRRRDGHFTPALVHEEVIVEGAVGRLANPLMHYSYPTIEDYTRKLDNYSTLAAEELFRAGEKFSPFKLVFKPIAAVIRKLIIQRGWKDGWEGYLIACLTGVGVLLKYAKLRALHPNFPQKRQARP